VKMKKTSIKPSSPPVQISLAGHQSTSTYTGSKWGIFLRAPRVFFVLKERCGEKLVPLSTLADLSFGLKSGCDKFFFPRDITDRMITEFSDEELKDRYGFSSKQAKDLRLIQAGDGSVHLLEARFLEPEIHGLMEIQQITLDEDLLKHRVVMIPTKIPKQCGHARRYVRWGETEGFHTGKTCASRVTETRKWYDLTGRKRGKIIWPKLQQYRHVVAHNPTGIVCNCNLYDVFPREHVDDVALCAVLNSTIVALMKFLYGSQMGREANMVTEIFDAKMLLVPNVRGLNGDLQNLLAQALRSMKGRRAEQLLEVDSDGTVFTGELAGTARQHLDDVVLRALGIEEKEERLSLRTQLYSDITELYRRLRTAEKKMQKFRSLGARGGRATPQSIAEEIWTHLEVKPSGRTLLDYVNADAKLMSVKLPSGKPRILKASLFQKDSVQIGATVLEFDGPAQCQLVKRLVDSGCSGIVKIPKEAQMCEASMREFDIYRDAQSEEFLRLAALHTADERLQDRVVAELWKKTDVNRK
jgi:hypothetical protein